MTLNLLKKLLVLLLLITSQATYAADGGDVIGRHIFGLANDYQGDPLLADGKPLIYEKSQHRQIINIEDSVFEISIFDHQVGGIYLTELDQTTTKRIDTKALNLANIGGIAYPTYGAKTAWNSLLVSEGTLVDANQADEFSNGYKAYYKGKRDLVKPYNYGWLSEVIVQDPQGSAKVIKNYALGRLFASEVVMMPDGKTFYLLDGKNSGNLYLFIAKQANSLAKGSLYVVENQQGVIKPLLLGNASALKMKLKLKKANYNAIFETAKPLNQGCAKSFTYINTLYGEECLKLKRKYKKYAALFEPIRFMELKGIAGLQQGLSFMKYVAEKQQLHFKNSQGNEVAFSVGEDQQLGSKYIILESL